MSEEASYYEQKLKAIYREEDLFRLAVRGHQFVDFLLWKLLEESTPGQHGTELKQLSLVAKVDVCLALRALPPWLGELLKRINWIRNQYAHRPDFEFTQQNARNMLNLLPLQPDDDIRIQITSLETKPLHSLRFFRGWSSEILHTCIEESSRRHIRMHLWHQQVSRLISWVKGESDREEHFDAEKLDIETEQLLRHKMGEIWKSVY